MTIAHFPLKDNRGFYFYLTPVVISLNLKGIIPLCGREENVRDYWFGVEMHRYDPDLEPKVITRILLRGSGWDFTE